MCATCGFASTDWTFSLPLYLLAVVTNTAVSLAANPRHGMPDHMALVFERFDEELAHFTATLPSHWQCPRVPVSSYPHKVFYFLVNVAVGILMGVR